MKPMTLLAGQRSPAPPAMPPGFVLPPGATAHHVKTQVTDLTTEQEYLSALRILPTSIHDIVYRFRTEIDEIKMDAGKPVTFRMRGLHVSFPVIITQPELDAVEIAVFGFKTNGRQGVNGTMHRVSAVNNPDGRLDKITFRFGRVYVGVAEPWRDVIERMRGIGLSGLPNSGKTTWMRHGIIIKGEQKGFGVDVVDTSNELLGDGDVSHPVFDFVRQHKVGDPENLFRVLQMAIRNGGTRDLFADEVGYQDGDVSLVANARKSAESITASVHAPDLPTAMKKEVLMPLFGLYMKPDRSTVIVDGPAFESFLEIHTRNHLVLHRNLTDSIERIQSGQPPITEHYFVQSVRL